MLIIALRRGGCGGVAMGPTLFRPCWENSTQHLIFVQHTEWGCRCQFHRHWHKAERWMEAVTMDRFFFKNALSTKSPLLFVLCTTHTWKSTEMQPRLKISWIYEMLESGFKHVTMNHDSQPWLNFPIFGLNSSTQPPNHPSIHPSFTTGTGTVDRANQPSALMSDSEPWTKEVHVSAMCLFKQQ